MIEILGGGVLGSILGGAFRLAPEVLKWMDRKNEREHELAMFDKQCELEKTRGQQKLDEIGAQRDLAIDSGAMAAFKAALDQQADMVKSAGGGVAALSASVRPVITYWILFVWSVAQVGVAVTAAKMGVPIGDVFKAVLTPDFMALVSGTINYWFLDRTLKQRGL